MLQNIVIILLVYSQLSPITVVLSQENVPAKPDCPKPLAFCSVDSDCFCEGSTNDDQMECLERQCLRKNGGSCDKLDDCLPYENAECMNGKCGEKCATTGEKCVATLEDEQNTDGIEGAAAVEDPNTNLRADHHKTCCKDLNLFCGKELTCIANHNLCIAGSSVPGSGGVCDALSEDVAKSCCTLDKNPKKTPGICVENTCKCVADGDECTTSTICCNQGKHGITCRPNESSNSGMICSAPNQEERKECQAGTSVKDRIPRNHCKEGSIYMNETCCSPEDHPDKLPGVCKGEVCICSHNDEHCEGRICCQDGKDGITCRNEYKNLHSGRKCIKESQVQACIPNGKICTLGEGYKCCHMDGCRCGFDGCQCGRHASLDDHIGHGVKKRF